MTTRTVWIVGATGLVGRETVSALLADARWSQVVAFLRRPTGLVHPRLLERSVDFEQLDAAFGPAASTGKPDAAVCCLGTTIKQAGSQERFRQVDHAYVMAFARAAKQAGARTFAVVTAMGSDSGSLIFYNRVKGDVEHELAELGFESLIIARPSLLIGERAQARFGERLMAPLSRLFPARYRGIEGATVARALVRMLDVESKGRQVVLSDELQRLGAAG